MPNEERGKHFGFLVGAGFTALLYDLSPTLGATTEILAPATAARSLALLRCSAVVHPLLGGKMP